MTNSFEDPVQIGEILPEVLEKLEQGGMVEPDPERHRHAQLTDLEAEIADLRAERDSVWEAIASGDKSTDLKELFDQITQTLLDAEADHIQLDGRTGSVTPQE